MATLKELLKNIETVSVRGSSEAEVVSLGFDSRRVEPGQMFFAIKGVASDGHDYIGSAVEKGASVIVCENLPEELAENVAYIQVPDTNAAMGYMASAFYGEPSSKLKLVGVTGTNGKTTTVTLLYDMFRMLGYKAGLISTVVYKINDRSIDSTHTTPDAIRLDAMIAVLMESVFVY